MYQGAVVCPIIEAGRIITVTPRYQFSFEEIYLLSQQQWTNIIAYA